MCALPGWLVCVERTWLGYANVNERARNSHDVVMPSPWMEMMYGCRVGTCEAAAMHAGSSRQQINALVHVALDRGQANVVSNAKAIANCVTWGTEYYKYCWSTGQRTTHASVSSDRNFMRFTR
jgi:hypothetical protein